LFAPDFGCFAFATNVIRVNSGRVFDFDNSFAMIVIFYKKVGCISALMLLVVNPENTDTVAFHPSFHCRVGLKAQHHFALEVTLTELEVIRTFCWIPEFATVADWHTR
jgi:hypothetical protein